MIDYAEIQKMSVAERRQLMDMLRRSLEEEVPPGILSETNHWEGVLEARQRFVDDPDQGEDMEDVMTRLRSRCYGN